MRDDHTVFAQGKWICSKNVLAMKMIENQQLIKDLAMQKILYIYCIYSIVYNIYCALKCELQKLE